MNRIIFFVAVLIAAAPAAVGGEPEPPAASAAAPVRLTLEEAIARARAGSASLEALHALEQASEASRDGAKAQRLPEAQATASYTRSSDVPELVIAAPGQPPRTIFPNINDNWASRVGVTMPLYTGGRVSSLIEAAEREMEAAAGDLSAGEADLVLETTSAYWDLVTARASVSVLEDALRTYDAHVTDARNRESHGLAARNEVLAVQVERDRAELARLRAANAASVVEANLARLIGAPEGTVLEPSDSLEPGAASAAGEASGTERLVERALRNRSERVSLEARARAAEARSRAARSGSLPRIDFNAGYDYARPNRRILPLTDAWNDSWDASVTVSYRFYDGGRTRAEVARDASLALAARRRLEDLDRRIRLEVTQRLMELDTARSSVDVAERNVVSATENRRVASERYRAGVIPSSELLDAETALLRASLDRTSALADARVAEARLDRAVGR